MVALVGVVFAVVFLGGRLPTSFLPNEDQGFLFLNVQLPASASLQRTNEVCSQIEEILKDTPGIQSYNTVVGLKPPCWDPNYLQRDLLPHTRALGCPRSEGVDRRCHQS